MKKKTLIGIGAAVAIIICLWVILFTGAGKSVYYTQIDNGNIEQFNPRGGVIDFNGGMSFAYDLTSFSEKGKETKIRFGTSRMLKEGAFIKLITVPLRGVIDWEEVNYSDLPEKVQIQYLETVSSLANNG